MEKTYYLKYSFKNSYQTQINIHIDKHDLSLDLNLMMYKITLKDI